MTENIDKQMTEDVVTFATKHSAVRVRVVTPNFERDYQRQDDGTIELVNERVIVRAHGKISKAKFGENEKYKTADEAVKGITEFWSNYYKEVRANRSDKEKAAEARRQKRYREKSKAELEQFKRQQ